LPCRSAASRFGYCRLLANGGLAARTDVKQAEVNFRQNQDLLLNLSRALVVQPPEIITNH
jgi:hypothetical protein